MGWYNIDSPTPSWIMHFKGTVPRLVSIQFIGCLITVAIILFKKKTRNNNQKIEECMDTKCKNVKSRKNSAVGRKADNVCLFLL